MTRSGIACRVHAWFSAQCVNLKSRVVAETVITIFFLDKTGLDLGIFLDEMASFWNIFVTTDVSETQHFVTVPDHLPQLLQLVRIVSRKNNLLHFL